MATSTTSRTPLGSPEPSRSRLGLVGRALLIVVIGAVVLVAGSLIGLRLARSGALPGVTVDGAAVGGLNREQLTERVESLATRKGAARITVQRDDEQYRASADDLGYIMDVRGTVDAVLYRGRQGNPIAALQDHLRSLRSDIEVAPIEGVRSDELEQWAQTAAEDLALEPREGGLTFAEGEVTAVAPVPGATVDPDALEVEGRALVLDGGGGTITAETEPLPTKSTPEDVATAKALADKALSAPVTLRRRDVTATLTPEEIATVLRTRTTDDGIALRVNPAALTEVIGQDTIDALETEPQSASFEISGGSIDLIKGYDGFAYDAKKAARQVLALATGDGSRSAKLDGETEEAELTTAEAKDLEVVEKVSEFTTYHACCESRVTNIHRIADIVDDVLIEPGETFSLNGHVGERTVEKGFAPGGAIFEGEFVEQIGGGVSQFTTTAYNAAYFGGYEIVEHKAHSYYISRYPVGREATLDYPSVDLKIKNNSPYGLVLSASYTDESITVAAYGKKWVKVDSVTGDRQNVTSPTTVYKENEELPEGSSNVIQEAGADGFDITVTRILTFPDGRVEREPVTTTYNAQPRIIERNT